MKPDDSMPFFGTSFFEATEGYSDAVAIGYMRALWHYWNHTHCQGLPDDDEYLRRICRCEPQQWIRTKGIIFDNQFFFCKNGTHWHQKKAKALHTEEAELYKRRVALAENARSHKPPLNTNADNKPDISPSVVRIGQEKELDRVEIRLKEIKSQGSQCAGGTTIYTVPQKAEMKALRDRRDQLKQALGYVA